jgi:imidazolonepropionase
MLVIRNIGELLAVPRGPLGGREQGQVPVIEQAAVVVDKQGLIAWFGPEAECAYPQDASVIDAGGGCVLPGLIDCHTHTVFAGTREAEFAMRLEGRSYAEIAEAGGGIRVTVAAVREADREQLIQLALPRLKRMLSNGVTTVEIKSGYGLTVDDELKMLETIRSLRELVPMELVATYLAAHTTPREFADQPDAYLDTVFADEVLSRIREEHLATFCDVFCDRTAFTIEQARRVLTKARDFGLRPRLHADQLAQVGASKLAGELGAVSADHLEVIDDDGLRAMQQAGVVGVLLPACSFFLGTEQAPARRIIEAGVPVAVATDYNPGSSMVESLPLTLSIACTQMKMTPMEAIVGATANAALAVGRRDEVGAIEVGMLADLVILDVPNHARWLYEPGRNCVRTVFKQGRVAHTQVPS